MCILLNILIVLSLYYEKDSLETLSAYEGGRFMLGNELVRLEEKEQEKSSPFALVTDEYKTVVSAEHARFVNLSESQGEILKICNSLLFVTERMISQYLESLNYDVDRTYLHNELYFLADAGYLRRIKLGRTSSTSIFNIYTVGYKGAGWLKANAYKSRLHGYVEQCECLQIKKILAANQVMIEMGYLSAESYLSGQMVVDKKINATSNLFRAHCLVQDKDKQIIVEAVRNTKDYKKELLEKLERIEKTLKTQIKQKTELIITVENSKMMQELKQELEIHRYRNFDVYLIYDRLLLENRKEKLLKIQTISWFNRLFKVA